MRRTRRHSSPKISRLYYYLAQLEQSHRSFFTTFHRASNRQQRAMLAVSGSGLFSLAPSVSCSSSKKSNILRVKSQYSTSPTAVPSKSSDSMAAKWAQKTVVIPPQRRGCHLVTSKVLKEIEQDLAGFKCGLAHFFLQHTSASLTINENYDSDVQADTETFLNRIVPEVPDISAGVSIYLILVSKMRGLRIQLDTYQGRSAPWRHTMEGPDDMPAHIKSSMFGCALTVPITDGRLNMGTWQGIWLCEHRDHATPRNIVITLNGI